MKHAVRALGWATNIFWIAIIAFTGTAIHSALNLRMSFGQPQIFASSDLWIVSLPLSINNSGYYDLSDLNSNVSLADHEGLVISTSTTFLPLIPRGSNTEVALNVSLNLNDLTQRAPRYLFNDTRLNLNVSMELRYAYVFAFRFSHGTPMDWGAPIYNFSTGHTTYQPHNLTHQKVVIPVSFENHSSFLNVTGTMHLEIYNDTNDFTGCGTTSLDVPPHSAYAGQIEALIDFSRLTESGALHFYFETSTVSFGPMVMSYG